VVNAGLTTLLGGSKATTAELKTLGVHVFDVHGKFVGMKGVLEQLTPKLKDMTEQQRLAAEKALFGSVAAKALNATIMAGAEGLSKATVQVSKHGAAERAAKAASETLGGQLKTLKAAFSDVMVIVGEKVIPVIQNVVTWFGKHAEITKLVAAAIGGVLVVAIGAYTVSMIAAAVATIAATWPILLVVAAVAALAAGIVWVATKTTWFQTIWQYMTSSLAAAWQWLWNSILAPIIRFVLNGFASITDGIANMLSVLSNIPGFGWAKTASDKMKDAANKAHALAAGIKDIPKTVPVDVRFTSNYSVIGQQVAALIGSTNKLAAMGLGHARGGLIGGSGTGDTVPGMLTPGEFIVRRDGSNINDALNHFGAKAGAGDFDYDRLAEAVSRRQIKAVISVGSVDRAMGRGLR